MTITISFATKPVAVKRIVSPRSGDKNSGRAIFHGTTGGGKGIREREEVWSTALSKTLTSTAFEKFTLDNSKSFECTNPSWPMEILDFLGETNERLWNKEADEE